MNEKEFEAFILANSARLLDKLRRHTPGASQRARAAIADKMLAVAYISSAVTLDEIEVVMARCIAQAHADGTFQRLASPHRCMCYLDKRVDCWHGSNPKTADHVVSFDWGGF